jgi:hypothetical protein
VVGFPPVFGVLELFKGIFDDPFASAEETPVKVSPNVTFRLLRENRYKYIRVADKA